MHRTNRVALACALVIGTAASAASGGQTAPAPVPTVTPSPTPTPAPTSGAGTYPSLPNGGVDADLSRSLGTFPTVDAAVAAAKAAAPPPGAYAVAIVGGEMLAIDAAGTVFHLAWMTGSGSGQRPPKDTKGQ